MEYSKNNRLDFSTRCLVITFMCCWCAFCADAYGQNISGCPSFGCTPTASFSIVSPSGIPQSGVRIAWTVQVSNVTVNGSRLLGCVTSTKYIVCSTPQGYVSLNISTGRVLWNQTTLKDPTLPVVNVSGDVIGTDGNNLIKINSTGGLVTHVIPLSPPMLPVYSVVVGEQNMFVIVSYTGEIRAYLTDMVRIGNITLRGNVERYNGTFHPISQPVAQNNRVFILTQFRPDTEYEDMGISQVGVFGEQRMFAVDVLPGADPAVKVAWYVNFEAEVKKCFSMSAQSSKELKQGGTSNTYDAEDLYRGGTARQRSTMVRRRREMLHFLKNNSKKSGKRTSTSPYLKKGPLFGSVRTMQKASKQTKGTGRRKTSLKQFLWLGSVSYFFGTVMASVAPPFGVCDWLDGAARGCCLRATVSKLWGIQDGATMGNISYGETFPLSQLSLFDDQYYGTGSGHGGWKNKTLKDTPGRVGLGSLIWAIPEYEDFIRGFDQISSQVQQILNVSYKLNTTVQITSRIMVAEDPIERTNLFIFGIRRAKTDQGSFVDPRQGNLPSNQTNFLIAVDTAVAQGGAYVMWAVPVPYDYEVQGQVALINPVTNSSSPMFIASAKSASSQIVFAVNFTLHSDLSMG